MRKAARPHAIRKTSGPETRVSLGVVLGLITFTVPGIALLHVATFVTLTELAAADVLIGKVP